MVRVAVRSTDARSSASIAPTMLKSLDDEGMAEFTILLPVRTPAEGSVTINVSTDLGDLSTSTDRHVRRPADRTRNADERHGRGHQPRHDHRVLGVPRPKTATATSRGYMVQRGIHGWPTT